MLDVIRRHGLIAFMLALAVVSLAKAVADFAAGRLTSSAGIALLMIAIVAEEAERRGLAPPAPSLHALRWAGFLGALAFLLREG